MSSYLKELFSDNNIIKRVKEKMPAFFQAAEMESSRAGTVGMEVGSVREKIIIALLIYKFGEENVETNIPITEAEIDVVLFNDPISIKTISGSLAGIKLIWTVDPKKALEFIEKYSPKTDLLLVNVNWNSRSAFYYFSKESQLRVLEKIGIKKYFKLPKPDTNPRGVEITEEAVKLLIKDKDTMSIDIDWIKKDIRYDVYERWVELWKE